MKAAGALDRVPAPALFIVAGFSQYFGAALAVGLFALAPPTTVAWARALVAAIVLPLLIRPWRYKWTMRMLVESGIFGIALLGMNMTFYIAIKYLPLGAAVALEFVGPVLVAVRGAKDRRSRAAVGLAAAGVVLISFIGLDWQGVSTADLIIGLVAIWVASAAWAWYMVLGGKIATQRSGQASLAVGMVIGVVLLAPVGAPWSGPLFSWSVIWLVLGMGVASSVLPYMLDQITIRRLGTATFALLNALLPATATVVGFVGLRQIPNAGEIAGLIAITVAVALAHRPATPHPQSVTEPEPA